MFIKLDIFKAFDTVNWPYLLSILIHLGFGHTWRNWIAYLWCTASSSVLVNGIPGKEYYTAEGSDRVIPYLPCLFLLAMEPLHMLFKKAQDGLLLQKLSPLCDTFRVSLYADDEALFLNRDEKEVQVMEHILKLFADASGLNTNLAKTQFYPVQCQDTDLGFLARMNKPVHTFPCTYLGLPLNTRRLTRSSLQPMIQKIGCRLPGWKRNFMTYSGRELLVKSVLSAMPTHFIIALKPPKWFIARVDKFRRSFLSRGKDLNQVKGGHYLVNWKTCLRPKK
jgi:hypothetical protein